MRDGRGICGNQEQRYDTSDRRGHHRVTAAHDRPRQSRRIPRHIVACICDRIFESIVLGIGTRKIAVDWHALNFAPAGKPGSITLELTRNQVRLAPEYKRGEPVVVVGAVGAERMPSGEVAAPER